MGKSRVENVSRNTIIGLVCQLLHLGLNFVTRTVFINVLGAEYLGVNGLFTNILTILSFAELGIGNAIIFNMYQPLAVKDEKRLGSLMMFYKKAYITIGLIIAGVGICIIPFLPFLIKDVPEIAENITVLYLLFLANTVSSYFFVYRKNIIIADQKNYIVLLINQLVTILKTVFQVTFLIVTHQYIWFLIIQILCTLIENIICSMIANKKYPFLKEVAEPLTKSERKKIFIDVKALAIYKFGSVILNGTDNILISALIGVREVGLVSNYVLLFTSCNAILSRITEAFTASVGNLNVLEKREKQYDIFKKLLFITAWIYGYVTIGLAIVTESFITEWIGSEYLLPTSVLLAILCEFYVKGVHFTAYTYRCTLGYFVQGRWSAFLAAILNLILSIILYQYIGLIGIFIATPIARILTTGIVDPILIYKYTFKRNVIEYYGIYLGYIILFLIIGKLCNTICLFFNFNGWLGVILDILLVTIIFNLSVILIFCRTKIFRELTKMFLSIIKRKRV